MIFSPSLVFLLYAFSQLHHALAQPISRSQHSTPPPDADIGLIDIIAVQKLGFTYEELIFKLEDVTPQSKSGAKEIAVAFRNFTAVELANFQTLSFTGEVPDLDQYSTVIAEFDLAVLEKAFLDQLTRRKTLFLPFKDLITKAADDQLAVTNGFTQAASIFGPRLVPALTQVRDYRALSLNRTIAAFA